MELTSYSELSKVSQTRSNGGKLNFNDKPAHKIQHVLHASRNFVDRLYAYKPSMRREEEEVQDRIEARQLERKKSKMLTKDWLDTQENIIKYSNAEKLRKKKLYDIEGEKILQEVEAASAVVCKKLIEDAMRKKFAEQCNVKRLQSAFRLVEVLNEQRAQLEFNERIREIKRDQKIKFMEKLKDDSHLNLQEAEQEKRNKNKSKLKYRKELESQLAEKQRERDAEKKENVIIKENFFEKLPRINTASPKEKKYRKYELERRLRDEFSQREFLHAERERDERLDDQHIQVFKEAEEKISIALKDKIKKAFEELQEARYKVQCQTASLYDGLEKEREMQEKAILDKRRIETKAREEAIKKANRDKYNHDIAEFLSKNEMILERNRRRKAEDAETKKFLAHHRMKLNEHDRKYQERKDKEMRHMQVYTRTFYKAQNEANEAMHKRETRRDMKCFQEVIKSQDSEDDEFKAYATALIEHCNSSGRDTRPLQKILKEIYKTRLR